MHENQNERKTPDRREYHRKWRAEHPEATRAAQLRYWSKKVAEMRAAGVSIENAEDSHGQK